MVQRRFRMLTGLTGLLVAAGVNGLLNDRGDGWVGSAYAQDADSSHEDADAAVVDESSAQDADQAGEAESTDESWTEADSSLDEEPVDEAVDDAEPMADANDAPVEPTAESVAEGPAPADPTPSQAISKVDRVREALIRHTREVVPGLDGHVFSDSDRLVDLGANSVDRGEIVILTMESLGLYVPIVELSGPKNQGELIALFASKMP